MKKFEFPVDILTEILCRLPKKSLARFKSVSKQWCCLISDRTRVFPKITHLGLVSQTYLPFCFRPKRTPSSPKQMHCSTSFLRLDSNGSASCSPSTPSHRLTNNFDMNNCLLLSSCDGFLLYRKEVVRKRNFHYVVLHPATDRSWHVCRPRDRHWIQVGLASHHPHHHFKLFLLSAYSNCFRTVAYYTSEVYSSETEEWCVKRWGSTTSSVLGHPRMTIETGKTVFLNGAFHWIWRNELVICHLGNNDCQFIKLPGFVGHAGKKNQCIWVSEGCVNFCRVSPHVHRIGIWSLHQGSDPNDQCSKRWVEKHNGFLAPPPTVEFKHWMSFAPLAFNDDFEIVYLMLERGIFSYNLVTKETKEACPSPFEGFNANALCIALPFLYLAQFDMAATTNGYGELCIPSSDKRELNTRKRRKLL